MAGVRFDNVTKRYGDVVAVDDLDLDVDDGEFMVLLGPSGCGKSTALRMVAGLEDISDGRVTIGDRVVNRVDPARRDVAMVFQSYALYPHMTVERNIVSPLRTRKYTVDGDDAPPRRLTRGERHERMAEAAEMLGLTPLLGRKPAALSGGQRQRVALARAVVGRPQAFLMDEPLSNLDAKLRARTRADLVDLHRRVGTTVIYVTHDQVEAMTMASRVAVLSEGQLQQVGTPQDVYERPANLFVARFIGTPPMNTMAGRIALDAGEPVVEADGSRFPVPDRASGDAAGPAAGSRLEEGRPVVVGVRPEHLTPDPGGVVRLALRSVEWLGHECLIAGTVGDDQVVVRRAGMVHDAGPEMRLAVDPGDVHLFDPDTTERLA